jgi:hypothetical protein
MKLIYKIMGGGGNKQKQKKKIDKGQLLLPVNDKRQTRPLVREEPNKDNTAKFRQN